MPKPTKPETTQTGAEAPVSGLAQAGGVKSGAAVGGNLVACVLVGGLLGWGLDWLMTTTPWGLIGGIVLGFVAWLRELWRAVQA